jgi:hypothetical protein
LSKPSRRERGHAPTTLSVEEQTAKARTGKVSGEDISRFDNFKNFAYAGITIVFGVSISLNDFGRMWSPTLNAGDVPLYIAPIVLFICLAVLMIRWIVATHHEFDLWMRWLDNPLERQQMYGAMITLAVILGLLLAFPHRIVFVTAMVSSSALFTYWTQWLCNDHFERALRRTRRQTTGVVEACVLEAMEGYWLKRPQLGRMAVIIFTSSIAFALAFGEVLFKAGYAVRLPWSPTLWS